MSKAQVWRAPGFEWLPGEFDALLAEFGIEGEVANVFVTLRETRFYVKLRRLRPSSSRWRPQRWRWLGFTPYRKREFDVLLELRAAGVPAVQPAVAAASFRGGVLYQELLATVVIEGVRDLRAILEEASVERADALCAQAGATVAGLHRTGFRHRDLFPRNILVGGPEGAESMTFLDCRKGGKSWRPGRNFAYDLACFDLWSGVLYPSSARLNFFAAYVGALGLEQGKAAALLAKVARQRASLLQHRTHRKRAVHKEHQQWAPAVDMPPVRWEELTSLEAYTTAR